MKAKWVWVSALATAAVALLLPTAAWAPSTPTKGVRVMRMFSTGRAGDEHNG